MFIDTSSYQFIKASRFPCRIQFKDLVSLSYSFKISQNGDIGDIVVPEFVVSFERRSVVLSRSRYDAHSARRRRIPTLVCQERDWN